MHLIRATTIILCLVAVSGCDKWPPYHEDLEARFTNSREAFEALEAKILETDYNHVSHTGIYGIPKFKETTSVVAYKDSEEGQESDFIEDDPEWNSLLIAASVFAVGNDEGVVSFTFLGPIEERGRMVFVEIIHSAERREPLKECLQKHKEIECGLCAFDLSEDWFVQYYWSPEEIVPDGIDAVVDGDMTEDAYDKAFDENLFQCRKNGYRSIGYDVSEWGD